MLTIGKIYYPFKFENVYIKAHWDFEEDLKDILERSGFRDDFSSKCKQRLKYLEESKEKCIQRSAWFEKLKKTDGLYSIKFDKSQKNIRIIFTFVSLKEEKYAVMLHGFEEKESKKKSKFSYDKAIPVAQKRLREVVKDD